MGVKHFRELDVWQHSMNLVADVYRLLKTFPAEEQFALSLQMRRAVVSIPSNIAEGFGRQTHKDFAHFLVQARGSLYEVETQFEIAVRLGYCLNDAEIMCHIADVAKGLSSLLKYLSSSSTPHTVH
jgi:four helix bundle protein